MAKLSNDQVEDYFTMATDLRNEAERYLKKGKYDLSIRRSQEAVEMFLKSLFRKIDIEYPPAHDLTKKIYEVHKKLKQYGISRSEVAQMILANETLQLWRDRAFYGDETLRVSRVFSQAEAELALYYAKQLYGLVAMARYKIASEEMERQRRSEGTSYKPIR